MTWPSGHLDCASKEVAQEGSRNNSNCDPVRMTLHVFHFLLIAFFPPSTVSSLRLSKPTLATLSVQPVGEENLGIAPIGLGIPLTLTGKNGDEDL